MVDAEFGTAHLVAAVRWATIEAIGLNGPVRLGDARFGIGDVRIDDRSTLIERLGARATDPDHLLLGHASQRWGDAVGRHVLGDWNWIEWDEFGLRALRDVVGLRPLYWASDDTHITIGSHLGLVARVLGADRPDQRVLIETLTRTRTRWTDTEFEGVHRLAPGHRLSVQPRAGALRIDVAQVDQLRPSGTPGDCDPAEAVRAHLHRAVVDRCRTRGAVATHLSGGHDSTTIASLASHVRSDVIPVSFLYPGWSNDEEPWIRAALREWRGDRNAVLIDASAAAPIDLGALAGVTRRSYHWPTERLMPAEAPQLTDRGVRVVLTGQGGDHGFEHIPIDPIEQVRSEGIGDLRPLRQGARHAVTSRLPARLASQLRRRAANQRWGWVGESKRHLVGGSARIDGTTIDGAMAHSRRQRLRFYASPNAVHTFESWHETRGGGIEMRHPFLDRRVIEAILALDPRAIGDHADRRRLQRLAFGDLWPPEIRERTSKASHDEQFRRAVRASVEPDGPQRLAHGPAAKLGLVDGDLVALLCEQFVGGEFDGGHESWRTLCLDAWLQAVSP